MATLTIRRLPDDVRDKLRLRAARKGRSMEAEVRALLAEAVGASPAEADAEIEERIQRLQEIMKPFRRKGRNVVDGFLAQRRRMWGEE